jgi:hypothetical protein
MPTSSTLSEGAARARARLQGAAPQMSPASLGGRMDMAEVVIFEVNDADGERVVDHLVSLPLGESEPLQHQADAHTRARAEDGEHAANGLGVDGKVCGVHGPTDRTGRLMGNAPAGPRYPRASSANLPR